MERNERLLRLLLRAVGSAALLAFPCAAAPRAWMTAVHSAIGLGAMPEQPIVGYLARSTSLLYGCLGVLVWVISLDVPRYRPIVRYVGAMLIGLGAVLAVVDVREGLPLWWTAGETIINIATGGLILVLATRRQPDAPQRKE